MSQIGSRFSETTLESRRPVWLALSDLFLDTSFDAADLTRIAKTLANSPYSLEQLDDILLTEVYPACGGNLLSIAGEWSGFDPEWLESRIVRGPSRMRRFWARTLWRIALMAADESWKQIRPRVAAERVA